MNPETYFTSNDDSQQWIQSLLATLILHLRHTRPTALAITALTITQHRKYRPLQHHKTWQSDQRAYSVSEVNGNKQKASLLTSTLPVSPPAHPKIPSSTPFPTPTS